MDQVPLISSFGQVIVSWDGFPYLNSPEAITFPGPLCELDCHHAEAAVAETASTAIMPARTLSVLSLIMILLGVPRMSGVEASLHPTSALDCFDAFGFEFEAYQFCGVRAMRKRAQSVFPDAV